eukprot:3619897-Rhodomonas_salina.2
MDERQMRLRRADPLHDLFPFFRLLCHHSLLTTVDRAGPDATLLQPVTPVKNTVFSVGPTKFVPTGACRLGTGPLLICYSSQKPPTALLVPGAGRKPACNGTELYGGKKCSTVPVLIVRGMGEGEEIQALPEPQRGPMPCRKD